MLSITWSRSGVSSVAKGWLPSSLRIEVPSSGCSASVTRISVEAVLPVAFTAFSGSMIRNRA